MLKESAEITVHISSDSTRKPAYLAPEQAELEKLFDDPNKVQFCADTVDI